jgi:uncharacterized RDD family membrane protein YckC
MSAKRRHRGIELTERKTPRRKREVVCPEGLPLKMELATARERVIAFASDMCLMVIAIGLASLLCLLIIISWSIKLDDYELIWTALAFFSFLLYNFWFMFFELAWQGRTPGKKNGMLRVVSRKGGELTPYAVIVRNVTRQAEFFMPLALFIRGAISPHPGPLEILGPLAWGVVITSLPLFNRDRLRAGDILGGTMVIVAPQAALLPDLTEEAMQQAENEPGFAFSDEHLSIYGNTELMVLEEILRISGQESASQEDQARTLQRAFLNVANRIGYQDPVRPEDYRRFLSDFYSAERKFLERGQIYGKRKEDMGPELKKLSQKPGKKLPLRGRAKRD